MKYSDVNWINNIDGKIQWFIIEYLFVKLFLVTHIFADSYLESSGPYSARCGDPEMNILHLDLHVTYADVIIVWFCKLVWVSTFLNNKFVDNEVLLKTFMWQLFGIKKHHPHLL